MNDHVNQAALDGVSVVMVDIPLLDAQVGENHSKQLDSCCRQSGGWREGGRNLLGFLKDGKWVVF